MCIVEYAYLEYDYRGIQETSFFEDEKISIASEYFYAIEFTKENTIKFYFKDTVSPRFDKISFYSQECRTLFFKLYLKMKQDGTYQTNSFYFSSHPIKNNVVVRDEKLSTLHDEVETLDEVSVFRIDAQGNAVSEQEYYQQQKKVYVNKLQHLFSAKLELIQEHENALQVFMSIEHTVLKFMMMYSYLYELCGKRQETTIAYIKTSSVFHNLPIASLRKRIDTKGTEREEDVFTYYRNLVGHSYHDILAFSEKRAICEIEILNNHLLRILINKMEGIV